MRTNPRAGSFWTLPWGDGTAVGMIKVVTPEQVQLAVDPFAKTDLPAPIVEFTREEWAATLAHGDVRPVAVQ